MRPWCTTSRWETDIERTVGGFLIDRVSRKIVSEVPGGDTLVPYSFGGSRLDDWPDFLWHDVPDVGSKAFSQGAWVVNEAMLDRGVVTVSADSSVGGEVYVHDDHIKNVFDLLYCGLGGVRHTVVHDNKRYGFSDRAAWEAAVAELEALRTALRFEAR